MKVRVTRGKGWYSDMVGDIFEIGSLNSIGGASGIRFYLSCDKKYFIRSENCILEDNLPNNDPVEVGDIVYIDNCEECPEVNRRFGEVIPNDEDTLGFRVDIPSKFYRDYTYISPESDTWSLVQRDGILQSDNPESRSSTNDKVNQPSHYNSGKYETIEIIKEIVKGYDDPFIAHCVGTAIKYLSRAPYKHDEPMEDIRKSAVYLEFAVKHMKELS